MRPLQDHHRAWLAAHPERDEAWLRFKLVDGFQVHHIDGDHGNDAPDNLVLIDGEDHFRIHGGTLSKLRRIGAVTQPKRTKARLVRGCTAYEEHAGGRKWGSRQADYAAAKAYAEWAGKPWPPQ